MSTSSALRMSNTSGSMTPSLTNCHGPSERGSCAKAGDEGISSGCMALRRTAACATNRIVTSRAGPDFKMLGMIGFLHGGTLKETIECHMQNDEHPQRGQKYEKAFKLVRESLRQAGIDLLAHVARDG